MNKTQEKKLHVTEHGYISIAKLKPDLNQPRKLFAADKMRQLTVSIKRDGIITPLILDPVGEDGKHTIINGERRYRAALEAGLKEVPYIVQETKDPVERLLLQFQIQETHEDWSPIEKAQALINLSEQMGITIRELCTLLSISGQVTARYVAFSLIADKKQFLRSEMPLDFAQSIVATKSVVKRIRNDVYQESFELSDEKAIETALISRIKRGDIRRRHDFLKIRDAFVKEPKFIDKFLSTNISPEAMFYESKAQGAYHLRNALFSATYVKNHIRQFLANPDIKLRAKDIETFKAGKKAITELLDTVGTE